MNKREGRLLCDVMPENGNLLSCPCHLRPNDVARGADVTMSSRSQRSASTSPRQRRASACGCSPPHQSQLLSSGYEQYQKSLLEGPWPADYGEASSDDLSSEWDSDVPDGPPPPPSKVVAIFTLLGHSACITGAWLRTVYSINDHIFVYFLLFIYAYCCNLYIDQIMHLIKHIKKQV